MNRFPTEDGGSWRLVQIADLLRRSHGLHLRALVLLSGVDADLAEDATVAFNAKQIAELETLGSDIADLVGQMHLLTDALPTHPAPSVTYRELRRDAERALTEGSFDPGRMLLAARVLSAGRGWGILASALRCTDAHHSWSQVTVSHLVTAFRDVDARRAKAVMADASIAPDTELSACTRDDVTRLAGALERHATPDR